MTKVAVVADLHWTARDADPYLTKVLQHNSADTFRGVKQFYNELQSLIDNPEIDKVVLLGDILDFGKNHGLNSLYQYRRGNNTSNLKQIDEYVLLLEEIANLSKHKKVEYIAGNHEDRDKLHELGVDFKKELEIDGVYFSHGDEFFKGLPYEDYNHPVQKLLRGEVKPGVKWLPRRLVKYVASFLDHAIVHNAIGTVGKKFKKTGGELLYQNFINWADDTNYSPRMAVFGHMHYQMIRDGEIPTVFIGKYCDVGTTILDISSEGISVKMSNGKELYFKNPDSLTHMPQQYSQFPLPVFSQKEY